MPVILQKNYTMLKLRNNMPVILRKNSTMLKLYLSSKFKIQMPKSQIPNPNPKSQIQIIFGTPNYFWHPKLFLASQIIFGIPNYFWHPKLFLASQIIFGIPNYFCHPKLFL